MNNTETIIKELEDAISEATYPDRPRKFMMSLELAEKVLTLLKEQQPRVMTMEASEQEWLEATLWLEIKGKKVTPCMYTARDERMMFGNYEVLMYFDTVGSSKWNGYMVKNYARTWRCWTSKPTDEQRQSEKWN